jgi:Secretion system C-terminal sorting domain/PKD-like domain
MMKKILLILITCFNLSIANGQDCVSCNASNWFTTIQPGTTASYSIPFVGGSSYYWTTSGGLSIISGQGTNSINLLVSSDGKLSVVRYGNGEACTNTTTIKVQQLLSIPNPCDLLTASFISFSGASSYRWYADGSILTNNSDPYLRLPNTFSGVIKNAFISNTLNSAKNICVEALSANGTPVSARFCIEVPKCPINIKIDVSVSCTSPKVFVDNVFTAVKYNWYINSIFIKSTDNPNLTNNGTGLTVGISNFLFWESVKQQINGLPLQTLCVEALNNSNNLVTNTVRTCVDFPTCVSSGGGTGGGGGSGGGGNPKLQNAMQLKVYPNPSSNELTVSISDEEWETKPYTVKMFDSNGQEVKSIEMTDRNQKIYTGDLPKDKYILKIINGKKITTSRILIE